MNIDNGKILIVDDNPDILLAAQIVLKKQFKSIRTESNPRRLQDIIKREHFDVILLDMNYAAGATSGKEGLECLKITLNTSPNSKVILMTAYAGVDLAIKVIKEGATDFVIKPWDNAKLLATVVAAMRHNQSDQHARNLETRQRELHNLIARDSGTIIGQSASLLHVFKQIEKVANTDANVLILGENGTGKELMARAIHNKSKRRHQTFVDVDIGAISTSLFESELFGHVKGAFTDAIQDRSGRFEVASGGTLFLDEIGNLNIQMQAKLLGALQNMLITRVGSDKPIKINTRLICATNMPLYEMVDDSLFRQDLLYRINTVEIRIPPLRERVSDIPLLADHFTKVYSRKYHKDDVAISQETTEKLSQYHWPGNIRELQHAIERAVIMTENHVLHPEDFLFKRPSHTLNGKRTLNLEQLECDAIRSAIQKHQGNLTQASIELGLARASLYRKIKKYGI